MTSANKPIILLVHGAWHGSWCWKYQIPELEALGYATETVDMPSASGTVSPTQADDAASVRASIESLIEAGKRVVVLAHSYGGPIAAAAILGLSERGRAAGTGVVGLIDLCAFIFPSEMDQGAAIKAAGDLSYVKWDTPEPGLFVTKDPRALFFPPDAPADRMEWAVAQLRPQSMSANTGIVPRQAWQHDAENYRGRLGYIRCEADVAVPLAQQDAMIEGAGGKDAWVVRTLLGSGHSPFLSRPGEVAAVVDEIISEFEKAT